MLILFQLGATEKMHSKVDESPSPVSMLESQSREPTPGILVEIEFQQIFQLLYSTPENMNSAASRRPMLIQWSR